MFRERHLEGLGQSIHPQTSLYDGPGSVVLCSPVDATAEPSDTDLPLSRVLHLGGGVLDLVRLTKGPGLSWGLEGLQWVQKWSRESDSTRTTGRKRGDDGGVGLGGLIGVEVLLRTNGSLPGPQVPRGGGRTHRLYR